MIVKDFVEVMNLTVFEPGLSMNHNITGGYTSDLLSDVMGHARQDQLWITLQNHVNIIAVASLKDLAAIILVHGQTPGADVLERAKNEGITLLGTELDSFMISARVFTLLTQDGTGSR